MDPKYIIRKIYTGRGWQPRYMRSSGYQPEIGEYFYFVVVKDKDDNEFKMRPITTTEEINYDYYEKFETSEFLRLLYPRPFLHLSEIFQEQ